MALAPFVSRGPHQAPARTRNNCKLDHLLCSLRIIENIYKISLECKRRYTANHSFASPICTCPDACAACSRIRISNRRALSWPWTKNAMTLLPSSSSSKSQSFLLPSVLNTSCAKPPNPLDMSVKIFTRSCESAWPCTQCDARARTSAISCA